MDINSLANNYIYTVYIHIFPNGKQYIGITSQEPHKRWGNGKGYKQNQYFNNAIKKYGWENIKHEILFSNLTKSEAENKEIELISLHRSNIKQYGYNIANGGNCNGSVSDATKLKLRNANLGKKENEETKSKKRIAMLGKNDKEKHPMWGTTHSELHKQRIGESLKGRPVSKETREKIRKAQLGVKHRMYNVTGADHPYSIKVDQYTLKGEFIKTWDALSDIERTLNISTSNISKCCKGKKGQVNGYRFSYHSQPLTGENLIRKKSVIQYNLQGEKAGIFQSIADAERAMVNKRTSQIGKACKKHKNTSFAYGYLWSYENDTPIISVNPNEVCYG